MAQDCNPCGTQFPVEWISLLNCNTRQNLRNAGIDQLAFIRCDTVVADLTSVAGWDTIRGTAGALIRTPNGNEGSWGKPNVTQIKDGCKSEVVTEKTLVLNFSTIKFDNTTFSDTDFICTLNDTFSAYTLLLKGCDGNLYYSSQWTTGTNPGLPIQFLINYVDNPTTGVMSIKFEITIDVIDTCFAVIRPSKTVFNAIFSGVANTSGGSGI